LSFIILWIFTQTLERPDHLKLIFIGLLTGVVYLTKPEIFLALATALAFGLYFLFKKHTLPNNSLGLLFGTFLIAPILTTTYFSTQVPLSQALSFIFLPWFHVIGSSLSDLPLYHWILGTDSLGKNIWKMVSYFLLITGFFSGLILLGRQLEKITKKPHLVGWIFSLFITSVLGYWHYSVPILDLPRSFPLIILVFSIYLFFKTLKSAGEESNRQLGLLIFSIFSLVLMFKMIFNVQIAHYGFALALPATLILIHILIHEVPKRISSHFKLHGFYRPLAITVVAFFIALHIQFEYKMYSLKSQPVGNNSDTLVDYHSFLNSRGIIFNDAIDFIQKEVPKEAHFVAIPGSIMLNYMTRRESPLKYIYLNPGIFQLIGEYQIREDLKNARPPYIILVEQKFPQHGQTNFGQDFGKATYQWILRNYSLIQQYGAQPFVTEDFGIQILKRKSLAADQ